MCPAAVGGCRNCPVDSTQTGHLHPDRFRLIAGRFAVRQAKPALLLRETGTFVFRNLPFRHAKPALLENIRQRVENQFVCNDDTWNVGKLPPPAKGKHGSAYALRTSLRLRTCSWSALVVMWLLGETDRLLRQGIIIGFHDVADGSGSGRRGHAFQFLHLHDL